MMSEQVPLSLAKGIETYLVQRRNKKEEEFLKSAPQKKKGVVSKGINTRLTAIARQLLDDHEALKIIEKSRRIKPQTGLEFQRQKHQELLSLLDLQRENDQAIDTELHEQLYSVKQEYTEYIAELNERHNPVVWLDEWSGKAKDISFATHVAKLTHSSSKGTSVLDTTVSRDNRYLTTNSLTEPAIDTASDNAASLPVADILKISVDGYSVLDCIKNDPLPLFKHFTSDLVKIDGWIRGLKQAYDSDIKQSYFLSKQVYFPIGKPSFDEQCLTDDDKVSEQGQYHLLLPLTSSSLTHAMHTEFRKYFDEEQISARALRKKKEYSPVCDVRYPNRAKFNVTGSNHSNASALNGVRGGKISLLCAQPPNWQNKPKSYRNKDVFFDAELAFELRELVKELIDYLRLLQNKTWSITQPGRANAVVAKTETIIESLFDVVTMANHLEAQPGWTVDSKLPVHYQLLFEPWREDDEVAKAKLSSDWQSDIAQSFGIWLNRQLSKNKKLKLTTRHSGLWTRIFKPKLREFVATTEVSL